VTPRDESHEGQPAVVDGVTFHGAITRLQVAATIDGQSTRVFADLPSRLALRYEPGSEVILRVDQTDVRCFPIKD
jgi:hypothetical protein